MGYTDSESIESREDAKGFDVLQIYPFTFAFLSTLVYLGAIIKMGQIADNFNVKQWIGTWPFFIAYLPIAFIVIAYFIHWSKRTPSKLAALIGLIGPSVLLFVGAYQVSSSAIKLSGAFGSNDCITSQPKYQMSVAWKAAESFMKTCKSPVKGFKPVTIDECSGYKDELKKHPDWNYLASIEGKTGCGGWCTPAKPLWVFSHGVQDPCSAAAGQALGTEVLHPAMQVAIYGVAVLFLATVGIAIVGDKLGKQGIDW